MGPTWCTRLPQLHSQEFAAPWFQNHIARKGLANLASGPQIFQPTVIFYGLMKLSIESKKTVANGILTCLNKSQAKIRSSGKKNKGREAALALIKVFVNE